jgi:hypothetical protein
MPAQNNTVTAKEIVDLLTPSPMSSVICVVAGIVLSVGVIFINRYRSSSLQLQYQYYQAHHTVSNSILSGSILDNSIIKELPLIAFWAIVGVVVYLIAADIVKALNSAIELRKELDYVHVHRKLLISNILIQFAIRVAVLIVSLPYLIFFFHRILPYCVKLSILATDASNAFGVAIYVLSSVIIFAATLHVLVILVRLLFLKARLFTYALG